MCKANNDPCVKRTTFLTSPAGPEAAAGTAWSAQRHEPRLETERKTPTCSCSTASAAASCAGGSPGNVWNRPLTGVLGSDRQAVCRTHGSSVNENAAAQHQSLAEMAIRHRQGHVRVSDCRQQSEQIRALHGEPT